MDASVLKRPSAWIPVALSLAALTLVLVHVAIYGVGRQSDEGATAHLFQILMVVQLPIIAFFAIRWLPASPSRGVRILLLQIAAILAALSPVYLLHL